jgi:hypothetical protein
MITVQMVPGTHSTAPAAAWGMQGDQPQRRLGTSIKQANPQSGLVGLDAMMTTQHLKIDCLPSSATQQ